MFDNSDILFANIKYKQTKRHPNTIHFIFKQRIPSDSHSRYTVIPFIPFSKPSYLPHLCTTVLTLQS